MFVLASSLGIFLGSSLREMIEDSSKVPVGGGEHDLTTSEVKDPPVITSINYMEGADPTSSSREAASSKESLPSREDSSDSDDSDTAAAKAGIPMYIKLIYDFDKKLIPANQRMLDMLNKINNAGGIHYEIADTSNTNITNEELRKSFFGLAQYHAKTLVDNLTSRVWFTTRLYRIIITMDKPEKETIKESLAKMQEIQKVYLDKVEALGEEETKEVTKEKIKEFVDLTNTYRNSLKKELAKTELLIRQVIKDEPIYKEPHFKKMFNHDYPNAIKSYNTQEDLLKKKLIEELNKKG
jgi:hypothetical protein